MRSNAFYYLLLIVLTATDAWLLAHPNLIGRFGIFIYDYTLLETLPKAMLTVGLTVLAAVLLSAAVKRFLSRPLAIVLSIALLAACVYAVFQTYVQFSHGTYRLTGSGFKTGAVLFPLILAIVFGKTSYDVVKR